LLPRPPECDSASQAEFRKALSGRAWQSLTPEFVKQRWSAYCYLSPKAYRYYLPALLVNGLPEAGQPSDFTHTVLFALRPCFATLFNDGRNAHWRRWRKWQTARQAVFTDAQHRAVCQFLGLFISDEESRYQHLAAQALRWRWNRLDTPALRAAQAYYHRLHHFTYPEPTEPEAAALCAEIRAAFADTPYPGDDQLASGGGDESSEIGVEFRGLRWQSVHPELLAHQYTATSFLSAAGLRYFLPAFLLSDVHYSLSGDPLYESNADPTFTLTHGLTGQVETQFTETDWRAYAERQFATFTRAERLAIIHYLEYQLGVVGSYSHRKIEAALASYWRPSAEAAP
jgi:hypothetical protein